MPISRRRWLAASVVLAVTRPWVLLTSLTGCGGGEEPVDPILRVPLAEIPAEGRIEREHAGVAVEFRREDGEVRARSLFCSHQFCRVKWRADEGNYLCPCDDGLFAADGRVLYGRAKKPLRELDVTLVGEEAWVDTHEIYQAAPPAPEDAR